MPYVIIKKELIDDLNTGIQRLLRPSHLRDEKYITNFYCSKVEHPVTGETALNLPETETVPIHIQADGAELQNILEVFVSDVAISKAEADAIIGAVQVNAGNSVRVADFIPLSWSMNVKTKQELENDGWFVSEEVV